MIFTDFAPLENGKNAAYALSLIFQPWRWKGGGESTKLKRRLKSLFFPSKANIFFYLAGRSALYHILSAYKLPEKSEVLVQGFTCQAVILPILKAGLEPVYVDITSEDFSMDPADLQKKITPRSKVLILQHTFGITPISRAEIFRIARKHKLRIIEDIAHGFSPGLFKNFCPNTLLLSFGRSKSFSSVFGSAVVTRDTKLAKSLEQIDNLMRFPNYSFLLLMALYKPLAVAVKFAYKFWLGKILHKTLNELKLLIPEISNKERQGEFDEIMMKKMPDLAALLLLFQLRTFNDVTLTRQRIVEKYRKKLGGNKYLQGPLSRYPYLLSERIDLLSLLKKNGISAGTWYSQPVAPQDIDLEKMRYVSGSCPKAEKICQEIVNLPVNISQSDSERIIKVIDGFGKH